MPNVKHKPQNDVEMNSYSLTVDTGDEMSGNSNEPKNLQYTDIPKIVVHPNPEAPVENTKTTENPSVDAEIKNDVFIELLELSSNGLFWRQKARWIKFEENIEPSGNWGRPFLPYIECESLRQLRHCIENGLVLLGSVNEGAYDMSHLISSMLILGGHADPKHRARLQQILVLPRMHQGESTARFKRKLGLGRKFLTVAARKRREKLSHAWELSDNEVRNRWVTVAQKALEQHRKENPNVERIKEQMSSRELCPEKYIFNENGHLNAVHSSDMLSNTALDARSIASEFSDISHLINVDIEEVERRGVPMTREQTKLRKIVHLDSKGIVVLHASVDFLKRDQFISTFIRYQNDKPLADMLEISIPVRFMYILFTSKHSIYSNGFQVCRAAATLFTDKAFHRCAMKAKTVADLSKACFVFIDGSVMIPPGEWQPELLTPVAGAISEIIRKKQALRRGHHRDGKQLWKIVRSKIYVISLMKDLVKNREATDDVSEDVDEIVSEENGPAYFPKRCDCPVRTRIKKIRLRIRGRRQTKEKDDERKEDDTEEVTELHPLHSDGQWFGGLRREIKQRYPLYWSDIKDGIHIQCFATTFYLAISLIAMCLTYGQVIAKYTKYYMGASEMLLATSISCILMAILGTEPLAVIAGTAAMLIFESSIYQASDSMDVDFLQFRWLTGMWIFIFLVLILAFDKAHWIHYCTRFTEEILHVLVALLFMYEGIKNLKNAYDKYPLRDEYITTNNGNSTSADVGKPNTALLYTIYMFATFGMALGFRLFEKTRFFSPRIRRLLNFFSIPVVVNVMNILMYFISVYLNTITIPPRLQLTSPEKRGRYVVLDLDKISQGRTSYWIVLIAAVPALLTVILLFIESEITLLECFKETRGRKGSGFHVNLFVVAIMALVSSFVGLPWMCLAAVETSVHLDSLKVWSSFDAPGVKSHVVKIREQRLTLFLTGFLVGLSALIHDYLDQIPEAVFSGMVLYMGVVALFGVQLVERFFLMFMAPGQHPDIPYLKNVPLFKVYLFTIIQIVCIVVLWVVKSIKLISFIFPVVVLLMIPLRALLGKTFTAEHMGQLDNEEDEEGHGPLD